LPEGDTVHLAARRLSSALAGERLTRTDLRVPAFATSDLSGQVVMEVAPRGKHLLFRTDGGITLHTHFKMEGRWMLFRPGEAWRGGPAHQIRAVLETAVRVAVGYQLGVVELLPTGEEARVVGHLGPDVLGPDWDPAEVLRRLRSSPERPVGEALIDQRVMSGPGNVYKCEACFLRGLDPWTPVGDILELPALVDLVKRLMDANRDTGAQITTGDTRPGRRQWVHGRAGQPCRRCGTLIRRGAQGGSLEERATYWCPRCQLRSSGTT
jgi:endonuclease-8